MRPELSDDVVDALARLIAEALNRRGGDSVEV